MTIKNKVAKKYCLIYGLRFIVNKLTNHAVASRVNKDKVSKKRVRFK